jgi:hypothetical protein
VLPGARPTVAPSASAPDRTSGPGAHEQPAAAPLPVGDAAAPAAAPENPAVEHPHGHDHVKQLPGAAAHGQETAAANKEKEKGKSASAPGHSGKNADAPSPATSSHPTHPEHPPKPSHPEHGEPSPPPATVPTETEAAAPAEAAADEGEPPATEGEPPGEHKGKP